MSVASARVFGFVAAEADVCVLLRRGPSKRVLMIRWDLATDEFELGQWLFARVREDQCDLSPDGRLFAYQADDRHSRQGGQVYLGICRPPFFSALAFWSQAGPTLQGLRWVDYPFGDDTIGEPAEGMLPHPYRRQLKRHDTQGWILSRGWESLGPLGPWLYWRRSIAGRLEWNTLQRPTYRLEGDLLEADWADVDHQGRVLFAREGRIFFRQAEGEREVIDLNPFEFRPLAAPDWAKRWPSAVRRSDGRTLARKSGVGPPHSVRPPTLR